MNDEAAGRELEVGPWSATRMLEAIVPSSPTCTSHPTAPLSTAEADL